MLLRQLMKESWGNTPRTGLLGAFEGKGQEYVLPAPLMELCVYILGLLMSFHLSLGQKYQERRILNELSLFVVQFRHKRKN